MKKYFFIIVVLIYSLTYSQGEANNWIFGYNAGVNFANGVTLNNISNPSIGLRTEEGCSTFSDSAGNLLFYSDGKTVWNANNNVMPNGSNLLGNASSTQSAMIIPKPGSATIYYIFTVGTFFNESVPGFNYYTIDMSADSSLGDVIDGPVDLSNGFSFDWTEKVAAVKGGDCDTYWVISLVNNTYYTYKISPLGVSPIPVISDVPSLSLDGRGYLKVSPNGEKIASAQFMLRQNGESSDGKVLLYDFNDITGQITNEIRIFDDINDEEQPYGLEFSRQSTKLYVSTTKVTSTPLATITTYGNSIYQYDIESVDIPSSKIFIHSQEGYRGALQLGPDGKIYATVPVSYWEPTQYLDIINNPDKEGVLCEYQEDAYFLGSGSATQGLPPFISSIFSPIEITGDDGSGDSVVLNGELIDLCIGDNLTISPEPLTGTATYEWSFNGNLISISENLVLTNITFANIGDYKLDVTSIDICGRTSFRQGFLTIKSVNEPPTANPIATQLICDDNYNGTYTFDFNSMYDTIILDGQNSTLFDINYFVSQADADANTNPLPVPYESPNITIFARIQNKNNTNCYDTSSFDVNIYQSALPQDTANLDPLSYCDNTSVGTDADGIILFDLTSRGTEILNGQSSDDFTLTYFTSDSYSSSSEIPDPINFPNSVGGGQTIYVRMTNNLESNCSNDTSFEIEVLELPVLNNLTYTLGQCDDDTDGYNFFNLEEINTEIITTITTEQFTYYETEPLALNGVTGTEIPNPTNYKNQIANIDTIWVRIANDNNCARVVEITIEVYLSAQINSINNLIECDNGNTDAETTDGKSIFDFSNITQQIENQFSPTIIEVAYYKSLDDATSEKNEISDPDTYQNTNTSGAQNIWIRIDNAFGNDCISIGQEFSLNVDPLPKFEIETNQVICVGTEITLEVLNPDNNYLYTWTHSIDGLLSGTNSTLTISKGGEYTVVASFTDPISATTCESLPQLISVVESDIATITQEDITITDDSDNNTVSINNGNNNLGIGNYEFSLDNEFGPFQDESLFENVIPGIHTIYVRGKNSCGQVSLEISVIGFPKFFTPNNDGHNDNWQILGVNKDFYPTSLIYIYDRYGKIMAKVNPLSQGWNGYYNGVELPSDDYWFSVQLTDNNGVDRTRKGHFSLIRR